MSIYYPASFSKTKQDGFYTFKLSDKQEIFLPPETAEKIEFVKLSIQSNWMETKGKTFNLNDTSPEIFAAVFSIASENKNIYEVLEKEFTQHPQIFEILKDELSFFYPSSFEKISKLMLKELFGMSLEDANVIVNENIEYCTYAFVLAEKKIKESIYFKNQRKAKSYYQKLNKYIQAYCTEKKIGSDKATLQKLKDEIKNLRTDFKKLKKSLFGKQNASRYLNDNNPLIRMEAQKAKKILKDNCATIKKALKTSGSDLSNKDVLNQTQCEQITAILNRQKEKNKIYFSSQEESETWFKEHPHPQDFKQHKLTIWAQHFASQYIGDENPKIHLAALKANRILKNYRKTIIEGLKQRDADLSQKKLLEHLIGPKNYLFSDYGLVVRNNFDPHHPKCPFLFAPGAMGTYQAKEDLHLGVVNNGHNDVFGYKLENSTVKALEEEIRKDLIPCIKMNSRNPIDLLPKCIITEDELAYIESEQLKSLKAEILPKLFHWSTLETEEKNSILQKILTYNEWTQYGIDATHITLDFPENIELNTENQGILINGELNSPKYMEISLTLNLYTLALLISGYNNPDTANTHLYLQRFKPIAIMDNIFSELTPHETNLPDLNI